MRKIIEKVSWLLVIVLVFLGFNVQVFASETGVTEHPLVEVLIEMTDSTSKTTQEDIIITLTNIETGEAEILTLTWAETYGIGELYRTLLPADIEYSVSCSVKGYDNIQLLDIRGGKVPSFSIPTCGVLFKWQIVDVQEGTEVVTGAVASVATDVETDMTVDIKTTDENVLGTSVQVEKVDTGNEDADEVFNKFLEAVSVIETDEKYVKLLNAMDEVMDGMYAPQYAKYTGGTEEEYKALSLYERWMVYDIYMEAQRLLIESGSYNHYFGSVENFTSNYIYKTRYFRAMRYDKDEEVSQAIIDILLWQYDYIMEHGCCYNFITGKSYLEIGGESKSKNEALQQEAEKNAADMKAVYDDLVASGDINEPSDIENIIEGKKGIGDVILDIIKDNVFSVILIVIILGLLGAIAVMKKKYNYTSGDDK